MPFIGRGAFKQIETDRIFHVGGVEIHHVFDAAARNMIKKVIRQIAVRINDADAAIGVHILQDEIPEERGFARTSFAYHIDVLASVRAAEADLVHIVIHRSCAKIDEVVVVTELGIRERAVHVAAQASILAKRRLRHFDIRPVESTAEYGDIRYG